MARPDDPTLLGIENTLADAQEINQACIDLLDHWNGIDPDAAIQLIAAIHRATQRIRRRTLDQHANFTANYHKTKDTQP